MSWIKEGRIQLMYMSGTELGSVEIATPGESQPGKIKELRLINTYDNVGDADVYRLLINKVRELVSQGSPLPTVLVMNPNSKGESWETELRSDLGSLPHVVLEELF